MEPYKTVNQKEIYNGRILRMTVDDIELPNGKIAQRESILHHKEGVGILPADMGSVYLVRQYRHALKKFVLEIPAGLVENGEDPKSCAIRELEEEVGFKADEVHFLVSANNCVGVSNDKIHIYLAEHLTKVEQKLDPEEFIEIEKYDIDKCMDMIKTGEIYDSKTILALYAYQLF